MNDNGNFKVPFSPHPIKQGELGGGRIFTLRGPRQVGKTRFLKHLQQKASHLSPIYESLDIVRTDRELIAVLRRLLKQHRSKLLLLDEISSVPRWQKAIKHLVDKGELNGIDCILSGSSATDIKRGAERLPGRRGPEIADGWDRVLLPLSFSQFITHNALLNAEDLDALHRNAATPSLVANDIHRKMRSAFDDFIRIGGFPTANIAWQTNALMPYRTMMAIIRSDFEKRKKSRVILDQVLARASQVAGTAMTWEAFAKTITSTKIIARQYVDELCENYLLMDIECIDLARDRRAPRKPRKLTWIDPLIPRAIAEDGIGNAPEDSVTVESMVAFELARAHETNLWEGLNQLRKVYLWRDSRGTEIDFVIADKEKTAVEVKWQTSVSEWDAKPMNKVFDGGVLVCKDRFARFGNVEVMPAYWFLYFLNLERRAK